MVLEAFPVLSSALQCSLSPLLSSSISDFMSRGTHRFAFWSSSFSGFRSSLFLDRFISSSSSFSSSSSSSSSSSLLDSLRSISPLSLPNAAPSFYKRELPPSLLSFTSHEGKRVFRQALHDGAMEAYFPLAEQYVTQFEPACTAFWLFVFCLFVSSGRGGGWLPRSCSLFCCHFLLFSFILFLVVFFLFSTFILVAPNVSRFEAFLFCTKEFFFFSFFRGWGSFFLGRGKGRMYTLPSTTVSFFNHMNRLWTCYPGNGIECPSYRPSSHVERTVAMVPRRNLGELLGTECMGWVDHDPQTSFEPLFLCFDFVVVPIAVAVDGSQS